MHGRAVFSQRGGPQQRDRKHRREKAASPRRHPHPAAAAGRALPLTCATAAATRTSRRSLQACVIARVRRVGLAQAAARWQAALTGRVQANRRQTGGAGRVLGRGPAGRPEGRTASSPRLGAALESRAVLLQRPNEGGHARVTHARHAAPRGPACGVRCATCPAQELRSITHAALASHPDHVAWEAPRTQQLGDVLGRAWLQHLPPGRGP